MMHIMIDWLQWLRCKSKFRKWTLDPPVSVLKSDAMVY